MYNILIIDDDQELCLLIKRSILSEVVLCQDLVQVKMRFSSS